jgi:thiol-disulfide isomerase/thioredoxin
MALHSRSPLPDLGGVEDWVNGEPDFSALAGHPVLVHFWSLTCPVCHRVKDQVSLWRDTYGPRGLAVIAVHQPRGPAELDIARVTAAAAEFGITQPCAIDNEHTLVDRFENAAVPGFYLFDPKHELRHFQAGDKGHDRIDAAIERVLAGETTGAAR